MIEYSRREAGSEDGERIIDHEGDYVKALIDKLNLDSGHVRVGVVVYHDTVAEVGRRDKGAFKYPPPPRWSAHFVKDLCCRE